MNLQLSEEQVLLVDSVTRLFTKHSPPSVVRAAEVTGMDSDLWSRACQMGLPLLCCPGESGGSEAGAFEGVLIAEAVGRHLAPIPLLEGIVATRLLSRCGSAGEELLLELTSGGVLQPITLALQDVGTSRHQVVPQGNAARLILALDRDRLVAMRMPVACEAMPRNLAALPIRKIDLGSRGDEDRLVLRHGREALDLFRAAVLEYSLLNAAFAISAARQSLDVAAQYARERQAFGKFIGSYQGLAHPMADSAVDLEGARLLVWRAAEALAADAGEAPALVAKTRRWAYAVVGSAVTRGLRALGGYGVSDEYDAQLYFRRAYAAVIQLANENTVDAIAATLEDDARPAHAAGETEGMTFAWDESSRVHMEKTWAFCKSRSSPEMITFQRESVDRHDPALFKDMAKEGLLYPDWPTEHGGAGLRGMDAAAIDHVIGEFGWDPLPRMVTDMVGKMVIAFGTDQARAEILPRFASGDAYAALGYSEPSGGSDIFAARTHGVLQGKDWIINGQKMFTSQGHFADYALMVVRTAPDKLNGLTLFVVPLRQPGFAATEIRTMGDERTNVTFYENVVVPDAYRLGEVHGGVRVLTQALKLEQSGGIYGASLKRMFRAALQWATLVDEQGAVPISRFEVKEALADLAVRIEVQDLLTRRAAWASSVGQSRKSYGPMAKLFGSESLVSTSSNLMRVAGPDALFRGGHPLGIVEHEFRRSLASTIYGGTSEVHRSLVAEDLLGLPRSR